MTTQQIADHVLSMVESLEDLGWKSCKTVTTPTEGGWSHRITVTSPDGTSFHFDIGFRASNDVL